jgi:hypothetical protein
MAVICGKIWGFLLAFSEPLFVCCITRRDKTASGLKNLSIPADYV